MVDPRTERNGGDARTMRSARGGSCSTRRSPSSFRRGILFAFFFASEGSGRTAPTRFGTAAFFATFGCRRRWRKEETSAFVRLSSFLFQSRSESLPLASMGSNPLRERKDFRGRGTSEIAKEARVDRSFESLRATLSFRRGVACENLFPCASNPYLSLAFSLLREILASSSEKETRLRERERELSMHRAGDPGGNLSLLRREMRRLKCPMEISSERFVWESWRRFDGTERKRKRRGKLTVRSTSTRAACWKEILVPTFLSSDT